MIKHKKPKAFYDTFERKGAGQKVTHYCPGCGHGTAHKLIAELIDEFKIQDRTIFMSPVGCAVFAYYYFDTGNIQCSHGRAPAVATGVRRTLSDAIIISYQGDGDLAGIGTTEIIHAANRGENLTVIFINNAIYGMTGGQMAPTTLIGQKTLTTPTGRDLNRDGGPIGMAEIINAIKAPIFIERVALTDPKHILNARKAFKKALQNQIDKKGFSFVEVLSPCPVNWKMEPREAREWIKEKLEPIFPVKKFRDVSERVPVQSEAIPFMNDKQLLTLFSAGSKKVTATSRTITEQKVKIAGFGGQGVMSAGTLLANCAVHEGLNATWLPSYGPEMRGGTANASVKISNNTIGSPVVEAPNVLIAMNIPSLNTFEDKVKKGGLIIVNSSIINRRVKRKDVTACYVPATEIAGKEGLIRAANIVVLTYYLLYSKVIDIATLKHIIPQNITHKEYLDIDLKLVQKAIDFFKNH